MLRGGGSDSPALGVYGNDQVKRPVPGRVYTTSFALRALVFDRSTPHTGTNISAHQSPDHATINATRTVFCMQGLYLHVLDGIRRGG